MGKARVKQAAASRTNRTAAAGVVVAVGLAVLRHHGIDVREVVEGATGLPLEDVMAAAATLWGAGVVWFREQARPRDEQDVVTPRP